MEEWVWIDGRETLILFASSGFVPNVVDEDLSLLSCSLDLWICIWLGWGWDWVHGVNSGWWWWMIPDYFS